MKTLKKVLGDMQSDDTKRFVDKHVVTKHPDPAGNGDDVFNATNVKKDGGERHGYDSETDHKVYEEMTDDEKAERERLVKGMKKGFSSFKERYGKDAKSVMYATATKQAMKEDTELVEGEEAHAQFQHYHNETAKLLKNISSGLGKHYDAVTDKKGYTNGVAHWGHVGDIKSIHRNLQDIHDSILQTGEYAKPAVIKGLKEELDLTEDDSMVEDIVELYELLDEEQQQKVAAMLENEQFDEFLSFIEELGDE
jgi:hypothetical protein